MRKALKLAIYGVVLIVTTAIIARVIDGRSIAMIRPGLTRADVIQILGQPTSVQEASGLFSPANCSTRQHLRECMFYRRYVRESVLVFLDDTGHVQCIERSYFALIR